MSLIFSFKDWRISADTSRLHQYDNETQILKVTGVPDGYEWLMNIRVCGVEYDALMLLPLDEGGVGCVLPGDVLAFGNVQYEFQLLGSIGEKKRHTNIARVFIPESISGDEKFPEVPTAFTQAVTEARAAMTAAMAAADRAEDAFNSIRALRVTVTHSGGISGIYSADKTFDEIKAAYDAGQQPYVVDDTLFNSDTIYTLSLFLYDDSSAQGFADFERHFMREDTLKTETLRIYSHTLASGSNIELQISEFNAPGGSVVIEGTASDDMSEVTITTPDAWTLVSEAWNSEKRPLVVLRLSDELYAYLTSVSTWTIDGQSQGMALFSLPPIRHLDSAPPYSIWLDESGGASILPVESLDGADGIGIQSVEQTVTSTEDGGTNIITVTKTDGTSSTFTVRNGSKGSTGATGQAGRDGSTPVRGTDYWTEADIATIQSYINEKTAALQSKSITDSGGHFTTDTVEGALQEIGAELAGINTLLGSGIQISFTIDDGSEVNTFSVVSGETWTEWIGGFSRVISETSGLTLYCYNNGHVFADEAGVYALSLNGSTPVSGSDAIISGATYTIINWGG